MDDPSLGQKLTLDDLVSEQAIAEICRTFRELFRIEVRVVATGRELPRAAELPPRSAFRAADIVYEGDVLGSVVLGPYAKSDSVITMNIAADQTALPRMKDATADRFLKHILAVLDVVLWSGHRVFLASQMQMSSSLEAHRELMEKNRQLSGSLERVKELDRLKSNFLGTVSHELRTPLTSILGYTEMLAEGLAGPLNEEQSEFIETIREKGAHLLAMISSILDLSKLDSETALVDLHPVDVGALCRDVVDAQLAASQKRGVTLATSVASVVPMVTTDIERLRKVVHNLVDNALKFTASGGRILVSVTIKAPALESQSTVGLALLEPANQLVEIAVSDTGIGIAPENLPRVFDAFYQVDNSSTRQYGGNGLGLSVVKRLTESLGGKVTVQSTLGRGTTFCVELPVEAGG